MADHWINAPWGLTPETRIGRLFCILNADDVQASPGKNGGSVTHEIACDTIGNSWRWRISLAKVVSDGPFSRFPEMSRILTAVDGSGIDLLSAQERLEARPLRPVQFPGDIDVTAKLVNGPVRNLNLICDAKAIKAAVTPVVGPCLPNSTSGMFGFLCLSGAVSIAGDTVPLATFILGTSADIALAAGAAGLYVTMSHLV